MDEEPQQLASATAGLLEFRRRFRPSVGPKVAKGIRVFILTQDEEDAAVESSFRAEVADAAPINAHQLPLILFYAHVVFPVKSKSAHPSLSPLPWRLLGRPTDSVAGVAVGRAADWRAFSVGRRRRVYVMDGDQGSRVDILEPLPSDCLVVYCYGTTLQHSLFTMNEHLEQAVRRHQLLLFCAGSGKELADGRVSSLVNSLARHFAENNQKVSPSAFVSIGARMARSCTSSFTLLLVVVDDAGGVRAELL